VKKTVFGFEMPEQSPGFLLWQATTIWQRLIKKTLEPYGVSHAQFVVLATTGWFESQGREINQSDVIGHSKLDKMTVSKSLKDLVEKGYIIRREHKFDTRAKTVCLTQKGKVFLSTIVPCIEKVDGEFFGVLKKESQQKLLSILQELVDGQ